MPLLRVAGETVCMRPLCHLYARCCAASIAAAMLVPCVAAASERYGLDRSGEHRVGKASFYANRFGGRKMADGTPMDLQGANAASKTLPLGTIARVINLENGLSAVVTIKDRGPFVKGRIVDLSPRTAREVGITPRQGVADVKVVPIYVPPK